MKKEFKNHTWNVELVREGRWSVCCFDPDLGSDGTDYTQWPTDTCVSDWIGSQVIFLESGDNPDYPEGIYQEI